MPAAHHAPPRAGAPPRTRTDSLGGVCAPCSAAAGRFGVRPVACLAPTHVAGYVSGLKRFRGARRSLVALVAVRLRVSAKVTGRPALPARAAQISRVVLVSAGPGGRLRTRVAGRRRAAAPLAVAHARRVCRIVRLFGAVSRPPRASGHRAALGECLCAAVSPPARPRRSSHSANHHSNCRQLGTPRGSPGTGQARAQGRRARRTHGRSAPRPLRARMAGKASRRQSGGGCLRVSAGDHDSVLCCGQRVSASWPRLLGALAAVWVLSVLIVGALRDDEPPSRALQAPTSATQQRQPPVVSGAEASPGAADNHDLPVNPRISRPRVKVPHKPIPSLCRTGRANSGTLDGSLALLGHAGRLLFVEPMSEQACLWRDKTDAQVPFRMCLMPLERDEHVSRFAGRRAGRSGGCPAP